MEDSQVRLNISIRFLPFGHFVFQSKGSEPVRVERKEQKPVYAEPKTTDTKTVEITFGGDNYVIPKTTGGLL
jgi:hypothetical protein